MRPASNKCQESLQFMQRGLIGGGVSRQDHHVEGMLGLRILHVDFLALNANTASYGAIRRAHRRGMKVYAWTVDDPVQMSVMMSRGVDGIITNQVALARQVQDLRVKLTPLGRFVVWMAGETSPVNV